MKELFQQTELKMKAGVDHLHEDLKHLRTGRASLGFASLTRIVRPFIGVSLRPLIALRPSWSLGISTKPNPFERPVSLSMITVARETSPKLAKVSFRSSPVR